ncbi:MAG: hypothetical protein CMK07_02635 [Ponticaulis sp.]|nr:hypothetical protein [Ponticaulis sp.]
MAYADAPLVSTDLLTRKASAWVFRTWMDTPPDALLDEWTDEEIRTDTYFVSPLSRWLLKLTGGETLELKVNLETRDGLERWTTEVNETFPLSPRIVHEATSLHLSDYACQQPERLKTFIDLCSNFSMVDVHKHVRLTTIGSTRLEWSTVNIAGEQFATLAFQADELEELKRILSLLGLQHEKNCDFGQFLRAMGY